MVTLKGNYSRRSKYGKTETDGSGSLFREYGMCYSRTIRMLRYPSRALLTNWVMEMAPQSRKFKRKGINLTSKEKEAGVFAFTHS